MRPRGAEAVFRAQTLLVHEWRKFPFLDPDLPDGMLPARWPRRRAHDLFHERHAEWEGEAGAWFAALEGGGARSAA
jgi:phenylacetic acid degradation operon negative regulatory protein